MSENGTDNKTGNGTDNRMENAPGNSTENGRTAFQSKYTKGQRVIAMIGVIALGGMVLATLICAICKAPANVVFALLFCDIIIPIMLWVFLRVTAYFRKIGESRKEEEDK